MSDSTKDDERNVAHKVLIVDDSEINRDLLTEMLEPEYLVQQAENGAVALDLMKKSRSEYSCVLLDLNMTCVNGYEVLSHMKANGWLNSLPVIIISAEENVELIKKAYSLGAIDYINRPFDMEIVKRRVGNTIAVYSKQKKLAQMVVHQVNENERTSNMLLTILGYIIEFRNKESGDHIENVSILTGIFLEKLMQKTDKYNIDKSMIKIIVKAAALHDAGKISVPENILNKPGPLTPEEFDVMKLHTLNGAEMLNSCKQYQEEPIVKTAYKICRWHHERYDGKGYPDGLVGDDIPIEAQIVALADVYDALTSVRCYKNAYTHEEAIGMILNGECGKFNPKLILILRENSVKLPNLIMNAKSQKALFQNRAN